MALQWMAGVLSPGRLTGRRDPVDNPWRLPT